MRRRSKYTISSILFIAGVTLMAAPLFVGAQQAGAPVWPGEPFFSLAHGEVGKILPDAQKDQRNPRAVLEAAAAAYARAAAEKGFIKAPA